MLTAPVVAELSSGAMAITDFASPLIFFGFTVIVYGLPVLAIRELATRLGLGLTGLWALGMVYGLFNEALFSETLFHPLEAHHEIYAGYGVVGNLLLPWAFYILPWHGLFSVVVPVVLVDAVFPRRAGTAWLPVPATVALGLAVVVIGLARFIGSGENRQVQTSTVFWLQLLAVGVAAAGFAVLARRLPRTLRVTSAPATVARLWRAFGAGAAVLGFGLLAADLLVELGAPWPVPIGYTVAAVVVTLWLVRRTASLPRPLAVAFGLGAVALQAAVILVVASGLFGGDRQRLGTGLAALAAIATAMVVMGRNASADRGPAAESNRRLP